MKKINFGRIKKTVGSLYRYLRKLLIRFAQARHFDKVVISLILLLGFIVRLYKIDSPIADWHSWRQADTASVSKIYVQRGVDLLHPRYHDISTIQTGIFNPEGYRFVEFPIYNALNAYAYNIYPNFTLEVWARLISIFSASLTTVLIYLIGKKTLGIYPGLISAFVYAFLPFNIYFTRVILPEPITTFFAVFSLWAFIKFTDKAENKWLYFSSLMMSIAVLLKPFAAFYGIVFVFYILNKTSFKNVVRQKRYWISAIIVLLPFFLWRLWISQFPEGIPFWKWAFNGNDIRFKPSYWYWVFGDRLGRLILGVWGIFPFAFAITKIQKKNLFIISSLLSVFAYVIVVASANVLHDYYQVITIPAISWAVGFGIWELIKNEKVQDMIVCAFAVFMMLLVGFMHVREFYKVNNFVIVSAGLAVERLTKVDDLVVAPYNGDTAFLYQTGRWGWPYVDRSIDELIEKGADYFVSVNLHDTQTIEFERRFETVEKTDGYVLLDLHKEI